ncbi:MAG: succinylglutamate desuccinylase/aspartoacylase family protein [Elainellaceae cyanobacterium]
MTRSSQPPSTAQSITVAGVAIAPGQRQRVEVPVAKLPTQTPMSLPVTVVNGKQAGPCLWLSAALHGDEINGVEIIRQVLGSVSPKTLAGTLIAVPVVNIFGFIEQSRYLPDRRDLNRSFPGSPRGSLAARLAHLLLKEVVAHCSHGIDLHTAAIHRHNLPQIRANLEDEETHRCAKAFGAPLMIHAATRDGSLRQAAAKRGCSVLLYEGGEALRFNEDAIQAGVEGIKGVMTYLNMIAYSPAATSKPTLGDRTQGQHAEGQHAEFPYCNIPLQVESTRWIRASRGGLFHLDVEIGQQVAKKQRLGTIRDTFGDKSVNLTAPQAGLVIGATRNPLVNQGDAVIHLAMLEA